MQELADEIAGQVFHAGTLVETVVKGYSGGQREQFCFVRPPGTHGAGALADEVGVFPAIFAKAEPGFVRPGLATGSPDHQNRLPCDVVRGDDRVVWWLHGAVSKVEDVLLHSVKASDIQPYRRQHGPTVLLTDPHD